MSLGEARASGAIPERPTGACLDYALTFADLKSRPTHPVDANLQGLLALVHRLPKCQKALL